MEGSQSCRIAFRLIRETVIALRLSRHCRATDILEATTKKTEKGGDMASKDKGGGKTSKKPAQHDLKAKRKAKKEKRAAK